MISDPLKALKPPHCLKGWSQSSVQDGIESSTPFYLQLGTPPLCNGCFQPSPFSLSLQSAHFLLAGRCGLACSFIGLKPRQEPPSALH